MKEEQNRDKRDREKGWKKERKRESGYKERRKEEKI